MNYLQKSKTKYPNIVKISVAVSLFIILSASAVLFPKTARNVLTTSAVPFWTVRDTVTGGFQNMLGFFSSKSSLIAEVDNLQTEVTSLELKQTDYDAISKENADLKTLFGQNVESPNNRVLARVMSKPPESPYDTFVLDAGSDNGLSVGDKVYVSETVLIGELSGVSSKSSIVNLFSKSGLINTFSDGRTGAGYQVSGQGGANMIIDAPKDADILWGDVFNYPDIQTSVVGSVFYIDQSAQSSFKTVYLRLPDNVFQTEWVYVQK